MRASLHVINIRRVQEDAGDEVTSLVFATMNEILNQRGSSPTASWTRLVKKIRCSFCVLLFAASSAAAATVVESDICVYGGTSGGVAAAVQATRMGKTVSLAVFNT